MTEEVTLDPASEEKLTSRIADKLKSLVAKREAVEQKEEEKLSGLADFIDQEMTKRVEEKLAEKEKIPEKKEEKASEKKDEKPPAEKTPEQRIKELRDELAKLEKPPEKKTGDLVNKPVTPVVDVPNKPSAATVNQPQISDGGLPQEVLDAIEEVQKNPIPGFATIFEYLYGNKKKNSGDQL